MNFEIKDNFYIAGKATKLISGAVHYFRIFPEQWEHSLYNLKAMGCNTVETYIPWNFHEPRKGVFNFEGLADVERFVELAQDMGLYIILRPSPYICAEWEFGGLPAWLLKDNQIRVRSQNKEFIQHVDDFFSVLLPKLRKYQFTQGGKVIMMQVENEYGSFSEDHDYLRQIVDITRKYGIDLPLFTSDGGWAEALNSGALGMDGVLATANFGSDAENNFKALNDYHEKHDLDYPMMCMEFWDGWFNNWGREIIRRDPIETALEVREVLRRGSINFYMFHGGTNFGFWSGSSDFAEGNVAQITSYDYEAPLTEWGAPTEKFYEIQKAIREEVSEALTFKPKYPKLGSYESVQVCKSTSLFSNLKNLTKVYKNDYPLPMEAINQNYGYVLYETTLKGKRKVGNFRVLGADDRVQVYVNDEWLATQYLNEIGQALEFELTEDVNNVKILVENQSRNNYGPKILAESQRKGIRTGVMEDIHFISHWAHYALELDDLESLNYCLTTDSATPSFYKFEVDIEETVNTFIDTRNFGKGHIYVNGFNLGRYWSQGPTGYLYAPKPIWKRGMNEVVVFETEGQSIETLEFSNHAIYI